MTLPTSGPLDRAARVLADAFDYGFVWDHPSRLTGSPGNEQCYDRDYWRHLAAMTVAAYSSTGDES